MHVTLTLNETRVLGSLIEKEITTPDQYPLSLNALTNACNQKSNRDPVLELDESTVQATLDELRKKHLVMEKSGFGSRVVKYHHRFANTEFSEFRFDGKELALVCVLFLRGPQTPGELRARTARLCSFEDMAEVEGSLRRLMEREDGPFVTQLAREPGRRESRYAHLFSGTVDAAADMRAVESQAVPVKAGHNHDRLAQLELRVEELAEEIERLNRRLMEQGEGHDSGNG